MSRFEDHQSPNEKEGLSLIIQANIELGLVPVKWWAGFLGMMSSMPQLMQSDAARRRGLFKTVQGRAFTVRNAGPKPELRIVREKEY